MSKRKDKILITSKKQKGSSTLSGYLSIHIDLRHFRNNSIKRKLILRKLKELKPFCKFNLVNKVYFVEEL